MTARASRLDRSTRRPMTRRSGKRPRCPACVFDRVTSPHFFTKYRHGLGSPPQLCYGEPSPIQFRASAAERLSCAPAQKIRERTCNRRPIRHRWNRWSRSCRTEESSIAPTEPRSSRFLSRSKRWSELSTSSANVSLPPILRDARRLFDPIKAGRHGGSPDRCHPHEGRDRRSPELAAQGGRPQRARSQ